MEAVVATYIALGQTDGSSCGRPAKHQVFRVHREPGEALGRWQVSCQTHPVPKKVKPGTLWEKQPYHRTAY
jgi:hypothetical protein